MYPDVQAMAEYPVYEFLELGIKKGINEQGLHAVFCLLLFPCVRFGRAAWWVGKKKQEKEDMRMWRTGMSLDVCSLLHSRCLELSRSVTLRNL